MPSISIQIYRPFYLLFLPFENCCVHLEWNNFETIFFFYFPFIWMHFRQIYKTKSFQCLICIIFSIQILWSKEMVAMKSFLLIFWNWEIFERILWTEFQRFTVEISEFSYFKSFFNKFKWKTPQFWIIEA